MKLKKKNILFSILALSFIPAIFIGNDFNNGKIKNEIAVSNQRIDEGQLKNYTVEEQISGYDDSGIVVNDGVRDQLYTWGNNEYGQLGHTSNDISNLGNQWNKDKNCFEMDGGYTVGISSPQVVKFNNDTLSKNQKITQVSLGIKTSAAVIHDTKDGIDHLYTWGDNWFGQLGYGTRDETKHENPQEVKTFDGKKLSSNQTISHISMGNTTATAVIHDTNEDKDHLYTWGDNEFGQLGNGSNDVFEKNYSPLEVAKSITSDEGVKIKQLSTFKDSSIIEVSTATGDQLFSWGVNEFGQLGYKKDGEPSVANLHYNDSPTKIESLHLSLEQEITQIAVTSHNSAAVVHDGHDNTDHLWMWGENNLGQLGYDQNNNPNPTPLEVNFGGNPLPTGKKITKLSLGVFHSAVVIEDGAEKQLYMWGKGDNGQLAQDPIKDQAAYPVPTKVAMDTNGLSKLSLGAYHSGIVVKNDTGNHIYMWGLNTRGQLGDISKPFDGDLHSKVKDSEVSLPLPPVHIAKTTNSPNPLVYIIIGSVVGLILLIVIIAMSIIIHKKKKKKEKKQLI